MISIDGQGTPHYLLRRLHSLPMGVHHAQVHSTQIVAWLHRPPLGSHLSPPRRHPRLRWDDGLREYAPLELLECC